MELLYKPSEHWHYLRTLMLQPQSLELVRTKREGKGMEEKGYKSFSLFEQQSHDVVQNKKDFTNHWQMSKF